MATRTGASMGILAALAFFALLSLVMFVLFVIFAARAQRNATERDQLRQDLSAAIRPEEQNDRWEELKGRAGSRQGVVTYLEETRKDLIRVIGANPNRDDAETVRAKIAERVGLEEGAEAPSLLSILDQVESRNAELETELADTKRARDDAQADMRAAIDRLEAAKAEHAATVATLKDQIGENASDVDRFRTDVTESKRTFEESLATVRVDAEQRIAGLEGDLEESRNRVLILEEQLDNLRGTQKDLALRGPNEATLVDGTVLATNSLQSEVSIGLGRRDNVVLGMTFEVYNAGSVIRPNAEGEYPQGKAAIEVIRIEESTSRARVIRSSRGNPVIEGDYLVNPIYDPNKTYVFTVYGNFDTNNDRVPTPQETDEIRGFIEQWGGRIEDDITGDTDFLVLGDPPILPPEPRVDDPVEVIDRYLRLSRQADQYDRLFETAQKTGIPVLNQNRFFTLTGLTGRR